MPEALRDRIGKRNIKTPLNTRDLVEATRQVNRLAAAHDTLWRAMRENESLADVDMQNASRTLLAHYGLVEGIG